MPADIVPIEQSELASPCVVLGKHQFQVEARLSSCTEYVLMKHYLYHLF